MATLNPNAQYRVVRDERVGIGPMDRRFVQGEIVTDLPPDVMQSLLDGQVIEEVPTEHGPGPNPDRSYRVRASERVSIGAFDRRLVQGQIVDDFPEDVLTALIAGQQVDEIPKVQPDSPPEPEPGPEPTPEPPAEPQPEGETDG